MKASEIINAGWEEDNNVWVMDKEGHTKELEIGKQIPFPYFYSDKRLSSRDIVEVEKQDINILTLDFTKKYEMYKISTYLPQDVLKIRGRAEMTAEDDIRYLERRLGADSNFVWSIPDKYAYIDIETKNGKIDLVGAKYKGKYEDFSEAEDFADWIEDKKIPLVSAWNGFKFDWVWLNKMIENDYWKKVMKMDSMILYGTYLHKTKRDLDTVARREKLGRKLNEQEVGRIRYNEEDCNLLEAVSEKYNLIGLEYSLANLTGVMPNNLHQIALLENYIMKNRERFGNRYLLGKSNFEKKESYRGGRVFATAKGFYDNITVFDYTSLYPNLVINSDYRGTGKEVYGVVRQAMEEFTELKQKFRAEGKKENNQFKTTMGEAYKILDNGSYGVFGTPYFRYSSVNVAKFIASGARDKLDEMKNIIEEMGSKVVYGDTDSNFAKIWGKESDKMLRVINRRQYPFEAKIEHRFVKFILFGDKQGVTLKRYAGMEEDGEMVVKGLEMIRSDWSRLAQTTQEKSLKVLLSDIADEDKQRELDVIFDEAKQRLLTRQVDLDELKITKTINPDYKYKVKAQHKKAYDKIKNKEGGVIEFVSYWMGKGGEPIVNNGESDNELRAMIDFKWYWERQLAPVKERLESVFGDKQTYLI